MTNYEELEGKEVEVKTIFGGKFVTYIGLVAGIEPDIGITIVNKEDKNDYLLCVNNPDLKTKDNDLYAYYATFAYYENAIRGGSINLDASYKLQPDRVRHGLPTSEHCSFL